MDGEHPALVHLAPALVGTPDSGLVWAGRQVFVAETEEEAVGNALGYYVEQEVITPEQGREMALDRNKRAGFITRDEDVLDTWFSSALWPFSTLGWPDETPEVERYYPTDVLVTGFDIIFFWVARMMMMGLHFMREVAVPTVYIHALVRDEKGAKMSKSKGNVIDPLAPIDDYGADALRFTLTAMAAQGRDIKLSRSRVEGYRNFATKLWNACRFAEMNACEQSAGFDPAKAKADVNRWIAHETAAPPARSPRRSKAIASMMPPMRSIVSSGTSFATGIWNLQTRADGRGGRAKAETRAMVAWARDEILNLLHPFMPFITEELWTVTARREGC